MRLRKCKRYEGKTPCNGGAEEMDDADVSDCNTYDVASDGDSDWSQSFFGRGRKRKRCSAAGFGRLEHKSNRNVFKLAEILPPATGSEEELAKLREKASTGKGLAVSRWEKDILKAPTDEYQLINLMWEIPCLGVFLKLTKEVTQLNISQYEVEMMLLMPQESPTLARILTLLLSPFPLWSKLISHYPSMPYAVWNERLQKKSTSWVSKLLMKKYDAKIKMFEMEGIEPQFWKIMGEQWEKTNFHELSLPQRVWMLKSLCDNRVHQQVELNQAIVDSCSHFNLNKELTLGVDQVGKEYLFFPQFLSEPYPCLRIYRRDSVLNSSHQDGIEEGLNKFELVAHSLQSLRELIEQLQDVEEDLPLIQRNQIPPPPVRNLLKQLSALLLEISYLEYNFEISQHEILYKLYQEWKDSVQRPVGFIDNSEVFWRSRGSKAASPKKSAEIPDCDELQSNNLPMNVTQIHEECNSTEETQLIKEEPVMVPKELRYKNGSFFVELESNALIALETDEGDRICIPNYLPSLSGINGKTLEELLVILADVAYDPDNVPTAEEYELIDLTDE